MSFDLCLLDDDASLCHTNYPSGSGILMENDPKERCLSLCTINKKISRFAKIHCHYLGASKGIVWGHWYQELLIMSSGWGNTNDLIRNWSFEGQWHLLGDDFWMMSIVWCTLTDVFWLIPGSSRGHHATGIIQQDSFSWYHLERHHPEDIIQKAFSRRHYPEDIIQEESYRETWSRRHDPEGIIQKTWTGRRHPEGLNRRHHL